MTAVIHQPRLPMFEAPAHISAEAESPLLLSKEQWLASSKTQQNDNRKPQFTIRKATVADAEAIRQIGSSVFASTFGFSMPSEDLKGYLEDAYSLAAIEADLQSKTKQLFVAQSLKGSILGFAQLTEGTTEPCLVEIPSTVELQRLYVNRESHGMGVGKALAKQIDSVANALGYRHIWLGVWEGNFVAQQVYEKLGYNKIGEHEFKMSRCIQTDWIMYKVL